MHKHAHKHRCRPACGDINTPGHKTVPSARGAPPPGCRSSTVPVQTPEELHKLPLLWVGCAAGSTEPGGFFCPRATGQVPLAVHPRPFLGKSPVTVATKRHSWGLFPPRLGPGVSMRGCERGCSQGCSSHQFQGCAALPHPAGTGSQAGALLLHMQGWPKALIFIVAGLVKEGAHCFAPKGGKSWSFPTPATLTPGERRCQGAGRGERPPMGTKSRARFWQWHHGVIAAPPRKTSSWSPEGILCGAGTDVAHLGSAGPGGVQTSRSCSMSQARRSRQLRASRGAWAQRRRLSDGW